MVIPNTLFIRGETGDTPLEIRVHQPEHLVEDIGES